ncbi:Cys-tRNA(Pro) deacylase [Litchfieldella xinjiangensis]|uniref:Cys-tRNA(Pro) deacylase n=1 Tax=Litchfieldella xinjiangensis TaxID=1166948 RepID=UPI0005B9E547|nr:Cys-tRNA(Pro) deacylase [Halomonas xinjiangensis]
MTPAVRVLERAGLAFALKEYHHDPKTPAYGQEAADALGLSEHDVFKTLLARLDDGRLVVALVPVASQLDLKALARAAKAKKASMADPEEAERSTGYVVGGISPLGQRKRLATYLDISATTRDTLYISAGRRGLEIGLSPGVLIELTQARACHIARH